MIFCDGLRKLLGSFHRFLVWVREAGKRAVRFSSTGGQPRLPGLRAERTETFSAEIEYPGSEAWERADHVTHFPAIVRAILVDSDLS